MKQEVFKCDICQVEKKEANHWWKGLLVDGGGIMLAPWDAEGDFGIAAHLCGEQHAIEWASKNLGTTRPVSRCEAVE